MATRVKELQPMLVRWLVRAALMVAVAVLIAIAVRFVVDGDAFLVTLIVELLVVPTMFEHWLRRDRRERTGGSRTPEP
uniref:hypothetical protein n=1 Tax=Saccharothrix mutabilis TaxID=33921 RepID=UPI0031D13DEF